MLNGGGKSVQINDAGRIAWWQGGMFPYYLYLANPAILAPMNFLLLGD